MCSCKHMHTINICLNSQLHASWTHNWTTSDPDLNLKSASACLFVVFQGDSGGPLLYNGIVVGITSNGGKKCGQMKKPGIYTIISHYTEWIDNTMGLQPTSELAEE